MNYSDNNKDNIELDDMDIRSHLNTSLDLGGITVSEDLINRTLEAIKKQSTDQVGKEEIKEEKITKKVIPWNRYVRGLASVAAAALIIVAGYNLLDNMGGQKKSESNSLSGNDTSISYDMAVDESASNKDSGERSEENGVTSAITSEKSDEIPTEDAQIQSEKEALEPQFSIAADSELNDEVSNYYSGAANSSESLDAVNGLGGDLVFTFRDIFLMDPEQAGYVTITDEVNKKSITLTAMEEITDFYTVMEKHQFTQNTEITTDQNYSVEISNPKEDALYTMVIGNYIAVNYKDNDVTSQSLYNVLDLGLLIQDLQEFFLKYSK